MNAKEVFFTTWFNFLHYVILSTRRVLLRDHKTKIIFRFKYNIAVNEIVEKYVLI